MDEADNVRHVTRMFTRGQRRPGLGVDHKMPVRIAPAQPPALVDVDVLIARLGHTGRDHGVSLVLNDLRINNIGEAVPRRPPHRRKSDSNLLSGAFRYHFARPTQKHSRVHKKECQSHLPYCSISTSPHHPSSQLNTRPTQRAEPLASCDSVSRLSTNIQGIYPRNHLSFVKAPSAVFLLLSLI
jgi:hypothetical protein